MSKKIKRLFWDIETSPNVGYFWRTGWKVRLTPENIVEERKIVCICWKWEGKKRIHSLTWNNGDDKQMIKKFLKVAEEADELIAHNGDRFDLPWFQGQVATYGFDPIPELKTVDTYQIAKRKFNYNNYSLDYLSQLWFGEKKIPTDYELWKRVKAGSKNALKEMVKYCKHDVYLQELVWNKLVPWYRPKTHVGVLQNKDRWTCPHDGSVKVVRSKARPTAAGMVRHQMQCQKCKRYYTIPNNVYGMYLAARGLK